MKNQKTVLVCLSLISLFSCKSEVENMEEAMSTSASIEVQGHRGDRGNFPENTIPAFISAVKKGVDVIELDVVISKDKRVVVSHEPYMSSQYVSTPKGDSIKKKEERSYNMYQMTYDSIRTYDSGSRGNQLFPHQSKMKTYKPLLSEVIDSIENFISSEEVRAVKYNIELKSRPSEYGKYQPNPEEFVDLVMQEIEEKRIEKKVNIQSFDPAILNSTNQKYPNMEIAYLVSTAGIKDNLKLLDFKPDIYSPNVELVRNRSFVDSVSTMNMRLIPWTVNNRQDIQRMIRLKVNGIITDYPERVLEEKSN